MSEGEKGMGILKKEIKLTKKSQRSGSE